MEKSFLPHGFRVLRAKVLSFEKGDKAGSAAYVTLENGGKWWSGERPQFEVHPDVVKHFQALGVPLKRIEGHVVECYVDAHPDFRSRFDPGDDPDRYDRTRYFQVRHVVEIPEPPVWSKPAPLPTAGSPAADRIHEAGEKLTGATLHLDATGSVERVETKFDSPLPVPHREAAIMDLREIGTKDGHTRTLASRYLLAFLTGRGLFRAPSRSDDRRTVERLRD